MDDARDAVAFDPERQRFNLFAPGVMDDPYPYYRILRDRSPVHFDESTGFCYLSRYADVSIARDRRTFIRGDLIEGLFEPYRGTAVGRLLGQNIFNMDDPGHARLRGFLTVAFTRSRVEGLRPRIEELCRQLLDEARLDGSAGSFELVTTLSYPLPFLVICEMLGISSEDRSPFLAWARDLLALVDPFPAPEDVERGVQAATELEGYLTETLGERRRDLRTGAAVRPGLLTELVRLAEEDREITRTELLSLSVTALVAGFENPMNLISNAVCALVENPQQIALLRDDPARYANLADEALRYYSTTQYNMRQLARPVTLHGVPIPPGAPVVFLRGAANRDERRFPEPDRFDLRRPDSAQHVGFGEGATYCLGAGLTRIEVEVAVRQLLGRVGDLRIARWHPGTRKLFWGPRAVDIEYRPAGRLPAS